MVITYNGDGQVSRVEDKAAGHTTEYEYDGAGRLIRAYQMCIRDRFCTCAR